ncbi:hypothetical protein MADP07_00620 [Mycoplasma anatis]|uniref:Uncharacterized protein n=1 Tax=Mycoplasmopsis anatis TaxID=171279 RepID=A0A9Q3QGE6_9BACT|nr:hypothetical protein [Mycoplasmopsis anatis]MBW0596291.1 hypothetical protein [Mycoplasmopsis anatis]MBW0596459.1 hypothetical protein [Mycoplasmopsis anatis]MBW0597790.1 hypothetical protein [Mycoplasmopsis anatis]MBW0600039.1 hypothetical protein [Mycoplasmopsis anatis]MBW0600668.1 hypothetical protein [Mycoplasmopsis anatis]
MTIKKHPFFGEINFNDPNGMVWEGTEDLEIFRIFNVPGTYIEDETLDIFQEFIEKFDQIVENTINELHNEPSMKVELWDKLAKKFNKKALLKDVKKFLYEALVPVLVEFYSESIRHEEGNDTVARIIYCFDINECYECLMINYDEKFDLIGYAVVDVRNIIDDL